MTFGTVAILGPGLIGGSLALALAERGLAEKLVIYARSARALDAIRTAGVDAELTDNPSEAVRNADIVVLCVPIETMPKLVSEFRDALKPTALVTDVGSVKGSVDRELAPLLEGRALWVGSHPMAGSEQTGFSSARADLFERAAAIVTPTELTDKQAAHRAKEFWKALGSRVVTLSPEEHDLQVAAISHLPHLIAAALVNHGALLHSLELAGGGFRDTTRIASGSPELWTEILLANANAMSQNLEVLIDDLQSLHTALINPAMRSSKDLLTERLRKAHDVRTEMIETNPLFKKRP
jgi:prephenate dehydrogenase